MNWMDNLGMTLLHFVWQGSAIALVAAMVNRALRRASSNARYLAACCALAAMGIAAIGTFAWISGLAEPSAISHQLSAFSNQLSAVSTRALATADSHETASWMRLLPWLDYLWFLGVCALALRSAMSWFAAQRLRNSGVRPAPPEWQERAARLMQRLAVTAPVRVCESAIAEVPAVIGWLRPVVVIPASALAGLTPEQLETVLAHELAHIRRHDYLINLMQTAIETVLFYHPGVWWVSGRMRSERENCCDDLAVEVCGDAFTYARALADLEQLRQLNHGLALAATDGSLLYRIGRLLGKRTDRGTRSYWIPVLVVVLIAAAGLTAQQAKPVEAIQKVLSAAADFVAPVANEAEPAPTPSPSPQPAASSTSTEDPEPAPQQASAPATKEDFIGAMERAGFKGLSVDQLVNLKIHGVTPEFVAQMKGLGFALDPDQLTNFRIHGVTPEYINEWKSRGWKLDADQLTGFKIHGVTAEAIDQMKALGFTLDADEAVTMKIHGITPEYAKSWRDRGYPNVTFDQLTALKIHGADAGTIKELNDLGFQKLSIDEVLQVRIFGVTPALVKEVRRHGFDKLTLEQVIKLKQFDIIPSGK